MTEREQYQGPELDKIKNDVIEQQNRQIEIFYDQYHVSCSLKQILANIEGSTRKTLILVPR